jgi:2,3-bisphosphoglycerate-independent phosphoglycerate mutase
MIKLKKSDKFNKPEGPVIQIIMDGIGITNPGPGNAVAAAFTPTLDKLIETCPHTKVKAHGKAVGLPSDGDMGNSEVGHNALGGGRIFEQGAKLVNKAIESKEIFKGECFKTIVNQCNSKNSTLHFIGLLSDGNVHSHIEQLKKIINGASDEGIKKIRVHILLDGRDVYEKSALEYIEQLENFLSIYNDKGCDYKIASGGGRMIVTMDRYEADWNIVKTGWDTHVLGEGRKFSSAKTAVETLYKEDKSATDQFLSPFVIANENDEPVGAIIDNDCVIFFNFRGDRAIEISKAFDDIEFDKFDRVRKPQVFYAGMMEYDGDLHIPANYLVSPPAICETMSEYLANSGVSQFACAETQKFGHVTYFWNGNRSGKYSDDLETFVEIKSDNLPFEQRPWMKSGEVTDEILSAIKSKKYDFIRVNFANGDMVGHTGHFAAAINAVECVDLALERIKKEIEKAKGLMVVTADHGNADEMFTTKKGNLIKDENGIPLPKTSHTLNPVIYLIFDPENRYKINEKISDPGLGNNGASIINLLGYECPSNYLPSLIKIN